MNDEKLNDIKRLDAKTALALLDEPDIAHAALTLPRDGARDPRLVYLASRVSPRSQTTMKGCFERIARAIGVESAEQIPWTEIDYAQSSAIRGRLIKLYRPATVEVTMVALRGVRKTAWRMGLISHEAYARSTSWEPIKGSRLPAGRSLTDAELRALGVFTTTLPGIYGAFVRATFAVLFGAGLRATELCSLQLGAFMRAERTLRFIRKGNKEAIIPLAKPEARIVDVWLAWRKKTAIPLPWLFLRVSMRDGITRDGMMSVKALEHLCLDVAKACGIERFSPHDCRRTFATRMLDAGVDLITVQRLMGHASPDTTAQYDRRDAAADAERRDAVEIWREEWFVEGPQ